MTTRSDIVAAARAYIDVPFRHQGRNRFGIDCVGVPVCVARDCKLPYKDYRVYSRRPDGKLLMERLLESLDVALAPRIGNVLVFELIGRDWPAHVAIRTDVGMIHAFSNAHPGRVVEHALDDHWLPHIVAELSYRGLED